MIPLFSATILLSSGLMFMVEPMIAKALLPRFGGTPQVWTAAMLFFQASLLVGYGYAHLAVGRLGARRQATVHGLIVLLSLALLPITLRDGGLPDTPPAIAVFVTLVLSVGVPYTVMSATSPLLQAWFAATGHRSAGDPYFLYAASNAGSLLGLLAYPFVVEPRLSVGGQTGSWSWGYVAFAFALATCGLVIILRACTGTPRPMEPAATAQPSVPEPSRAPLPAAGGPFPGAEPPPTWRRRAHWILLAFIPSSLLLGVTTHIQTDIAAVPLLWVVPLALYLLTFVVAFASRPFLPPSVAGRILPLLIVLVVLGYFRVLPLSPWITIVIHDLAFFVAAVLAHGRLAADRPDARHLTEFYCLLAVGGALGGLFNALVAPSVFDQVLEYPIVLVLALLARSVQRPSTGGLERRQRLLDLLVPFGYFAGLLAVLVGAAALGAGSASALIAAAATLATLAVVRRPVRFALAIAGVLAITLLTGARSLYADRTFFGVSRVTDDGAGHHVLLSGLTVHGIERTAPDQQGVPLSYYHSTGPAGVAFATLRATGHDVRAVGAIGLGGRSLAAYARAGGHYTFYEIDPVVIRIARDPAFFTFIAGARAPVDVVEGDGRLRIAEAADGSLDLVVLDAFSSDAVPAHLLTREAFATYATKLRPGGAILVHVTNTYLDLRAVVEGAAEARGLTGLVMSDRELSNAGPGDKEASDWVLLAPEPATLAGFASDARWQPLDRPAPGVLWTDDFSDLIGVIRW